MQRSQPVRLVPEQKVRPLLLVQEPRKQPQRRTYLPLLLVVGVLTIVLGGLAAYQSINRRPGGQASAAGLAAISTAPPNWHTTAYTVGTGLGTVTWREIVLADGAIQATIDPPVWIEDRFSVVVGEGDRIKRFESTDGVAWLAQPARVGRPTSDSPSRIETLLGAGWENELPGDSAGQITAAMHDGHFLAVGAVDGGETGGRPMSAAWLSGDGREWRLVNQVTGDPTAVRSVAGGPAGWAFTWHQCAPGCGQEIWLSADGIEWDRLKMINSAKAGSFVVPSGISVGATAIVLAGISYDTSPYTGVNPVVLWVGSIG